MPSLLSSLIGALGRPVPWLLPPVTPRCVQADPGSSRLRVPSASASRPALTSIAPKFRYVSLSDWEQALTFYGRPRIQVTYGDGVFAIAERRDAALRLN